MRIALDAPKTLRPAWRRRLLALGMIVEEAPDTSSAMLTLLIEPPAARIGARLAGLEATGTRALLAVTDDPGLDPALALVGALRLPLSVDDAVLAHALRFAGRLAGEAARRHALEATRAETEATRLALCGLAPFEADGVILGEATGRYRAQRLLAKGPAFVALMAIDGLAPWSAAFGPTWAARLEATVATLLVQVPARLGDVLHRRTAPDGWGLWLPGDDRAGVSAVAGRLLDAVEARRLFHDPSRADAPVTLSAGIAFAPALGSATAAEARALAALDAAAALGGNRIRWAD